MEEENKTLSERFMEYEKKYQLFIDHTKYTILRMDGRSFSKLTKRYAKPFDSEFIKNMNYAGKTLFKTFQNIFAVYVQSDEITVILKPTETLEQFPFKGRVDKLLSLSAASVAANFTSVLYKNNLDTAPEFDSRYFQVDTIQEAINALIYRQNDCIRNAISMIGQKKFPLNELQHVTTDELIEKLKTEKRIDVYKDYDSHLIFGRLIVKNTINYENHVEEYTRSEITIVSKTERFRKMFDSYFNLSDANVYGDELLKQKYN